MFPILDKQLIYVPTEVVKQRFAQVLRSLIPSTSSCQLSEDKDDESIGGLDILFFNVCGHLP